MKKLNKQLLKMVLLSTVLLVWGIGCNVVDIDDRPDPNNSELQNIIENPSRADISTLVSGTEAGLRTELRIYHINMGMIGREMYRFLAAEPRNTGDLLGKGNAQLDAGSFYTTRTWASFYRVIRNANITIQAATTLNDGGVYSGEELNGTLGYARTMKAYQYLMALTQTNENGIRQQLEDDIFNAGELLSKEAAYQLIADLLDEAATNLTNAGSAFPFNLSSGFDGLNTPATFREFNRGLRARVEVYRPSPDWNAVLTNYLPESFIDETEDLGFGAYHIFSTATNDLLNQVFADPQAGSGDSWVAHNSWVEDAEAGDLRVDQKVQLRDEPAALDDLSSDYGLFVYQSQTAPMPILRNAELLLIRAEALAQRNNAGDLDAAEDDLNIIRNAAGLGNFSRGVTGGQIEVIDEMLNQRRYELFFEGHRWVDMRRYDRLNELPIDRPDDNVWVSFPIPENENIN
ncbi:RagB/SusD family nutrient uptake outer membrane protein [Fodinibius sp.]|uniref:RagB/SusD family nutrient uptake outer membrane protein n=1 Tax=Fodinibius sp. TaxID=1872440 RepID=UPI002ACDB57E|nr:RagB/SusD family nutrient uptake outer membrane protein [Fodinibius sp.]MDZ7659523.1 RagB/SusD family nutrient uptake outer membrane protein [Fodinibius sp.]